MSQDSTQKLKQVTKWKEYLDLEKVCSACGYSKCKAVIDAHHINPEEKEFNIAGWCRIRVFSPTNIALLREELKKCIWLCKNCHAELHERLRLPARGKLKGFCTTCEKRPSCTELCKEVLGFVNQDHVPGREIYLKDMEFVAAGTETLYDQTLVFPPLKRKILRLLQNGKTRREIAKALDITRDCLRQHLRQIVKIRQEALL